MKHEWYIPLNIVKEKWFCIFNPENVLRVPNYMKPKVAKINKWAAKNQPDYYNLYHKAKSIINFSQAELFWIDITPQVINPINVETNEIKLRDYQQQPVDKLLEKSYGFLKASTWYGKSYSVGYIINKIKQRTVILCHNTLVWQQMEKRLAWWFWENKVWMYYWQKKEFKDITVVIYNSYQKFLWLYNWQFDVLIVDEFDLFLSWDRLNLLTETKKQYHYWLSATTYTNKMKEEDVITFYWRMVEAKEYWEMLLNSFNFNITWINVWDKIDEYKSYWELKDKINEDPRRMEAIKYAYDECINRWNKILIMTDTKDYSKRISEELWIPMLDGDQSRKKREENLKEFENKKAIVSVHQIIWRWYDDPYIDAIIVAFSTRSIPSMTQILWRALRIKEWKTELYWYDIIDKWLYWQWKDRFALYKQFWTVLFKSI